MRHEMITLIDKLEASHIPYEVEFEADFDKVNLHLFYPKKTNDFNTMCSVISNSFSYGGREGLLEIYGRFTDDEAIGWLTANDVFARIYTDYINSAD